MPDAIHVELDQLGHVMANQLKAGMAGPLGHIGFAAGEEVVKADHLLAGLHQPVHQVRPHEAGAAGDQVAVRQ